MNTVIVRYKVKADQSDDNVGLVEAVFAALKGKSPEGVRYATFVADDGVTFFHIASFDDGVENPLPQLDAFKAFQKGLGDRCEEGPVPTSVKEVASYNFFS